MIKIENPNTQKFSLDYFDDVKKRIKHRCDYLIKVFDVLFNNSPVETISNHNLNGNTRKSLTNQFLRNGKLYNQDQYDNVIIGNCYPWVILSHDLMRNIAGFINNDFNLEALILCSPDDALNHESYIKNNLGITQANFTNEIKKYINSIIDYSLFDKYAYDISSKLNVNTCPYCNRNYINTVFDERGGRIIRPTFDHFFPQTHHPFLALSFYNLIPSCYYCNSSLKSAANITMDTHMHPYIEGFNDDVTFGFMIIDLKQSKSAPENYSIFFRDNMGEGNLNDRYRKIFGGTRINSNENEGNINLFKLTDIYQSHLDVVGELVVKCDKLNERYAESLKTLLGPLGSCQADFYNFYFGNYINENNFHRRPMAKLTRDVVLQIFPWLIK
ncbi:MAG: hypothetical protein ACOYO1_11985 [Bacteroidales bacterium]